MRHYTVQCRSARAPGGTPRDVRSQDRLAPLIRGLGEHLDRGGPDGRAAAGAVAPRPAPTRGPRAASGRGAVEPFNPLRDDRRRRARSRARACCSPATRPRGPRGSSARSPGPASICRGRAGPVATLRPTPCSPRSPTADPARLAPAARNVAAEPPRVILFATADPDGPGRRARCSVPPTRWPRRSTCPSSAPGSPPGSATVRRRRGRRTRPGSATASVTWWTRRGPAPAARGGARAGAPAGPRARPGPLLVRGDRPGEDEGRVVAESGGAAGANRLDLSRHPEIAEAVRSRQPVAVPDAGAPARRPPTGGAARTGRGGRGGRAAAPCRREAAPPLSAAQLELAGEPGRGGARGRSRRGRAGAAATRPLSPPTLDRRLQEELERARRYSLSFSLVLLDVDGAGRRPPTRRPASGCGAIGTGSGASSGCRTSSPATARTSSPSCCRRPAPTAPAARWRGSASGWPGSSAGIVAFPIRQSRCRTTCSRWSRRRSGGAGAGGRAGRHRGVAGPARSREGRDAARHMPTAAHESGAPRREDGALELGMSTPDSAYRLPQPRRRIERHLILAPDLEMQVRPVVRVLAAHRPDRLRPCRPSPPA